MLKLKDLLSRILKPMNQTPPKSQNSDESNSREPWLKSAFNRVTGHKLFGYLLSPFSVGLIISTAMAWISVQYYEIQSLGSIDNTFIRQSSLHSILDQIHRKSIDFRLINRGPIPGHDRVVILAIDNASIDAEGRWPWPRDKIGKLIENTLDAGASVIGFDVAFSEKDQNSSVTTLSRLQQELLRLNKLDDVGQEEFTKMSAVVNTDKKLADIVGLYADQVVMGAILESAVNVAEAINSPPFDFCLDSLYERRGEKRRWEKDEILVSVVDPHRHELNLPLPFGDGIRTYMDVREASITEAWFEKNSDMSNLLIDGLRQLGLELPADQRGALHWLFPQAVNGNEQAFFDFLSQVKPEFANRPMIRSLIDAYLNVMPRRRSIELINDLRKLGEDYCRVALTQRDTLLNRERFDKEILTTDPEQGQVLWSATSPRELFKELPRLAAESSDETLKRQAEAYQSTDFDSAYNQWRSLRAMNLIPDYARSYLSYDVVADQTKHTGYFNADLDPDGTIRKSMLVARHGNTYYSSLASKMFSIDRKLSPKLTLSQKKWPRIEVPVKFVDKFEYVNREGQSELSVPVDDRGRMQINYAGSQKMFAHISATSLLNNRGGESDAELVVYQQKLNPATGRFEESSEPMRVKRNEFLKDKLVIVGATALALYDLRNTPFEENYPGVETHANVLSNLLAEHGRQNAMPNTAPGWLKSHPFEARWAWLINLLIGVSLSAFLAWLGPFLGLSVTAGYLFTLYAVDRYYLFANNTLVNVSLPFLSCVLVFVGSNFYRYFIEERKKREMKGTFAKYVSPAVVDEILKDPGNIELGGKKMELTVMFSDVRGFTTISEKLDPRALSDLLNSYLTPMTDLVFETKGTLDKYMGDAIMAFWGAPIHFADHAEHAARCALKMLVKLRELQESYRAKGLPEIDIGIGLNTGDMSVGNMGSNTVRSYTVMGDSVNLGSRLEGINKQYGTRIIISEFTRAKLGKTFITREVDWVRVKGKALPVRIFELMGEVNSGATQPDPLLIQLLPHFEAGFAHYHARRFAEAIEEFNRALHIKPDDECSKLYVERCQDYVQEPPEQDWDGVYTMKTK